MLITRLLLFSFLLGCLPLHASDRFALPEFPHANSRLWFNSEPLRVADLKGKVVLLDFWAYGCWNCYRSFPWLHELEEKLSGESFQVVGIHTPEFDHEKDPAKVAAKIREFKLTHPVMMDNDFAYWNAMNNRYWPTFYLIDKQGDVRSLYIGETHSGDERAQAIEADIRLLLAE